MTPQSAETLFSYIATSFQNLSSLHEGILVFPLPDLSPNLLANSFYFGHPEWSRGYLEAVHRDSNSLERWLAVTGSWQDKIVIDIGCGPGNVYATMRDHCGAPKLLIGVDVAQGALKIAQTFGYTSVLADAQRLPFVSDFADIVFLNAALHHCDDMEAVLREAGRLVRPSGLLVADFDVQQTMWQENWVAKTIWNARLPWYRLIKRGGHATADEQFWSTATEIHHRPGDGVTTHFFERILQPLGFNVRTYPHNRTVGAATLEGKLGRAPWNIRLAQRLSGVNPDSPEGAMVLMCVAKRCSGTGSV